MYKHVWDSKNIEVEYLNELLFISQIIYFIEEGQPHEGENFTAPPCFLHHS